MTTTEEQLENSFEAELPSDDDIDKLSRATFDGVQECEACGNSLEPDCGECSCGEITLTASYGLY